MGNICSLNILQEWMRGYLFIRCTLTSFGRRGVQITGDCTVYIIAFSNQQQRRQQNFSAFLGPLLLTGFNFNPSMDK